MSGLLGTAALDFTSTHTGSFEIPKLKFAPPSPNGFVFGFLYRFLGVVLSVIFSTIVIFTFGLLTQWQFTSSVLACQIAIIAILTFTTEYFRVHVYELHFDKQHDESEALHPSGELSNAQHSLVAKAESRTSASESESSALLLDFCLAIVASIALAPSFLLLVLLVRLETGGPSLVATTRIGKGGKSFRLLRFRLFRVVDAEGETGLRTRAKRGHASVGFATPASRYLLASGLVNLPELLNVVRGEIALTGPPALPPHRVAALSPEIRERLLRLRPGIVGVRSVRFPAKESLPLDEMIVEELRFFERAGPSDILRLQAQVLRALAWRQFRGA